MADQHPTHARADRIASQIRFGLFDRYLHIIVDAGNERYKVVYRPGESGAEGSKSASTLLAGTNIMRDAALYVREKNLIQPGTDSKVLGVTRSNAAAILHGDYDELAAPKKDPSKPAMAKPAVPTRAELRARMAASKTSRKKGVK